MGTDAVVDVRSAIELAFQRFYFQETVFLPSVSTSRSDLTGRDKKIAIFSTCEHSINNEDEQTVCTEYATEDDRSVAGDKVEFTIFNVRTSTANIGHDYLYCLTEDDYGRQYYVGNESTGITLEDFTNELDAFAQEICHQPTPAPTKKPTKAPFTPKPTESPTPSPTKEPTDDPTKRPTTAPKDRCSCNNLGYKLKLEKEKCMDWNQNAKSCTPGCGDYCDYTIHCYTYSLVTKTPECEETTCKEEDEHGNMVPHKPEYVIFPHRNDCEREMGHSEYWTRVYEVSYDLDGNTTTVEDPKKYAVYDSDPDDQCNDATGIKIPVKEWNVDGEYQFQICLFGESDSVSADTMDVGWGYSIERSGFSNWDYGYKCDNNIALPDICSAASAYYAHSAGRIEREMDSNDLDVDNQIDTKKSTPIDLLKAVDDANGIATDLGGSFGDKSKNYFGGGAFGSGLYSVFSAHAQTVILAVLAVLSLTVFMCAFGLCKCDCRPRARRKGGKGGDLYGSVVDRLEEEDISDGTDSEEDHSDSDELIDH